MVSSGVWQACLQAGGLPRGRCGTGLDSSSGSPASAGWECCEVKGDETQKGLQKPDLGHQCHNVTRTPMSQCDHDRTIGQISEDMGKRKRLFLD